MQRTPEVRPACLSCHFTTVFHTKPSPWAPFTEVWGMGCPGSHPTQLWDLGQVPWPHWLIGPLMQLGNKNVHHITQVCWEGQMTWEYTSQCLSSVRSLTASWNIPFLANPAHPSKGPLNTFLSSSKVCPLLLLNPSSSTLPPVSQWLLESWSPYCELLIKLLPYSTSFLINISLCLCQLLKDREGALFLYLPGAYHGVSLLARVQELFVEWMNKSVFP